jgi:hypothetical protein
MFDTHLINVALAGLSITAGVAILIAAAIIGVATTRLRHGSAVTGAPISTTAAAPAPAVPERLAA